MKHWKQKPTNLLNSFTFVWLIYFQTMIINERIKLVSSNTNLRLETLSKNAFGDFGLRAKPTQKDLLKDR